MLHHPSHVYLDNTCYFLTARIYNRNKILDTDNKKKILSREIYKVLKKFNCKIFAYVILENHYHLLLKTSRGTDLPKILNLIHGRVAYKLNKIDNTKGRKVFQNYWDYCIRNKNDFWKHFNYIHNNPIKHGHTNNMNDYKFSSYNPWLNKKGYNWLNELLTEYPITDFGLNID